MSLAIRLNKRVTIQANGAGQDENGQPIEGWADVATVWASIMDISGREYVAAAAAQNSVTTKITIRHRDGIKPAMRVMHGADTYNIEAVLGQDNRTLTLMCARAA
jgi:SPP1 family predicted phage head-tail adaptor